MARMSALALKEMENNWESELCSLILVKLHIRFVVFGSSAWSSETEVSEPAADCGVLDRSPRPRRRELRAAGEAVYVQRDAIRDTAFSKARPV